MNALDTIEDDIRSRTLVGATFHGCDKLHKVASLPRLETLPKPSVGVDRHVHFIVWREDRVDSYLTPA